MGTSASSRGPGSGADIPIVPPWVDNPPAPTPPQTITTTPKPTQSSPPSSTPRSGPPPPAPTSLQAPQAPVTLPSQPGRWRGARTSLGKFASGGADRQRHLTRGLGHYSRSGMGGAANTARRLRGSSRSAGVLHTALTSLAQGTTLPPEIGINAQALAGLSPQQVLDAIVDAIRPIDGTQDAEATRDSAARALSEIMSENQDLTSLTVPQIDKVTASLLGHDVALRIELDVGKAVIDKAPTKVDGLERLQEMKDYVREVVAQEYAVERARVGTVGQAAIERISDNAIRQTFEIFEEEAGL